jgi:hypothetical protein
MDRKATITFTNIEWSGWDPEGYAINTWATFRVAQGKVLHRVALGAAPDGPMEENSLGYEVLVERIVADRVGFAYRGLVITNNDGTINLTAPNTGRFILQCGETRNLATPTMDAGTTVTIRLDNIR